MRRFLAACLVLLICLTYLTCLPAYAQEAENLIYNGDFSLMDEDGMPDGWHTEMWYTEEGVSRLYTSNDGYEGKCAVVQNTTANDARFVQSIAVEPDSTYRFSCMVRAADCGSDGYGATISFENSFSYSEEVLDTAGEWQELVVYGRTGKKQSELTLMLRVGGYGNIGSGKAYFDNVQAVRVDEVPEGCAVLPLSTVEPSNNSSSVNEDGEPKRNTEAYLLLTGLYALLVLAVARRSCRIAEAGFKPQVMLAGGLVLAFGLRLVIGMAVRGYNTDINCFTAWSERMYALGPGSFYVEGYFCDYPPGYMLLLWPVAALRSLLGAEVQGYVHLALLKMIPIACDILGALLVWRFALRHRLNQRVALLVALLYAFNPAVIIDSAAWGQIDSVLALLLALCALEAVEERYIPALLAFAAAVLIKPQALLFAPLGVFAIAVNLVRGRSARKLVDFAIGVAVALGLMYLCALVCFGFEGGVLNPVRRLIELYKSTLGSYSYLTVNALNIYQIFNLNWALTAKYPIWTVAAWCLFALAYVYAGVLYAKSQEKKHLLLIGALLLTLIYCFGPKIHERYIFPAMLLLTLAYAFERDKRLLLSLTVMTAMVAMNELLVLQGGITEANYGHLQSSEQWLNMLLSFINVANAMYLCWVAADICICGRVRRLRRAGSEVYGSANISTQKPRRDHRLHLGRVDCLLMAVVTLAYAGVAYHDLGDMDAPQTTWVSSQAAESVTLDLGDVETFRAIYYGGICDTNFMVELSYDGENWTAPVWAKYNQGEIFRWIYFVPSDEGGTALRGSDEAAEMDSQSDAAQNKPTLNYFLNTDKFPMQTARYFRITAKTAGLKLSEIGFWSEYGELLPVTVVKRSGEDAELATDPALLIDEQSCVAEVPSYLNSTYFDEIYHARTAYELLHGESVYEWTHPPLGKVLMMVGVKLFGMTPFGWRFMGALMGVMMVPLMYLLAKQLTKDSKLAFIAMCLMALDSMHFTQTRIATIDSYAVFWIMLEYFLMFRFFQMDWREVSLGRSLVTLGLCGATMGVAMATKWIGVYAAVGLAVIYFWKLAREIARAEAGAECRRAIVRSLISCAFCLLFFIIIPLCIYYFSHYWQLVNEGVKSFGDMFSRKWVERVVELQQQMLNYHAGLGGDTHYFRSPWYQWPVIWWPMWYYSGADYVASDMVSSISCMGNPAVWWTGLLALIAILIASAWRRKTPKAWLLVLIGFASQFLPWVLVPRSTFIYHYFASVPFIILCTVLCLQWIRKKSPRAFWIGSIALVCAALVLFAAFYPLESGMTVSKSYAEHLRWFKWHNY